MLLPLIGFLAGIFISSLAAVIVFSLHPKWKISLPNLALFVIGSFMMAIALTIIYTMLFAVGGTLQTKEAVIGYFGILFVAVIAGGILVTHLGRKFLKMDAKRTSDNN